MNLRDRSVIVTGASSGIGRRTSLLLANKGARVWAVARNEARLKELAAEHPGITPFRADVTDDGERAALVEAVGEVDILVNNAGLGWNGRVEDMPAQDVRHLFELNVLAVIDLTQRVLPGMLERRRGHIVNVASIAGWTTMPPLTVYSSTKAAVQSFSDGLRREALGRGVTVTHIDPGPIKTEFFDRAMGHDPNKTGEPPTVGLGTGLVAHAIYRSIVLASVPGYQVMAVPRVLGLTRLSQVPGVTKLLDVASVLGRGFTEGISRR